MNAPRETWVAVACLDGAVAVMYLVELLRGRTQPRIATWLIFELGVLMSLATYFASRDHSAVKAALNLTDAVAVTLIVSALLGRQRGLRVRFTRNEQACLLISCVAVLAWAITKTPWVGFVGFQVVMCVAYLPTLEHLWRWELGAAPEPIAAWSVNAIAALGGVWIALSGGRDYLAALYPLRAALLCLAVVVLGLRWRWKTERG